MLLQITEKWKGVRTMDETIKKIDELRERSSSRNEFVESEAVIEKAICEVALMPVEHLYYDAMFDNRKRIDLLHDLLLLGDVRCRDMNEILREVKKLRDMKDDPDDDIAYEMIDKGLFFFDEEDEYEASVGAGEMFRRECLSAYTEIMQRLSDICMGWCIHGIRRKGESH